MVWGKHGFSLTSEISSTFCLSPYLPGLILVYLHHMSRGRYTDRRVGGQQNRLAPERDGIEGLRARVFGAGV